MTGRSHRRHARRHRSTDLVWRLALTGSWLSNGAASLALAVASRQVNTTDLGPLTWLIPFSASVVAAGFALAGTPRYLKVSALAAAVLAGYGIANWLSSSFVGTGYLMALAAGSAVVTLVVFVTTRNRATPSSNC